MVQIRPVKLPIRYLLLFAVIILGSAIVVGAAASSRASAMDEGANLLSDCNAGDIPSVIDTDTTLAGDLFVTNNVTVRNGATLTLTAGTHITICGDYDLNIQNAMFHAVGTAAEPIIFDSDNPAQKWGSIKYTGNANQVLTSTLQYMEVNNGGGNDPNDLIGAIHIIATWSGTTGYSPVIDHVTIRDSGAYGIHVTLDEDDPTPPAISNLTVMGSAAAPISLGAAAAGGLGGGNSFSGNGRGSIEVRYGTIKYNQNWRRQPIPYELPGPVVDVGSPNDPILTLQPGVVLWMGEDASIRMQGGGLVAEGTATSPITITRAGDSAPLWGRIYFNPSALPGSRLAYVNISYAGSNLGTLDVEGGNLSLDHVTVQQNPNGAGVSAEAPFIEITNSAIEFNKVGVHFIGGADGLLRNNVIRGNAEGGVLATSNGNICVDAIGNDWGNSDGPTDSSGALDACNQAKTHAGGGDAVSDGILYEPWLSGGDLADQSSITPNPHWVVANGVNEGVITITARDAAGQPLPGKVITLETTRGTLVQPVSPTNVDGVTTAIISSTVVGDATITAYNQTDDAPLSAIASVYFWQGYGDTGPLIDPSGAPYASPELLLEGEPFQEGFPMIFRVPMQNSSPDPVDVTVVYAASDLGVGLSFTPVDTTTMTLAPGESWDALGGWVPDGAGHRCVQATISSNVALDKLDLSSVLNGSSTTIQINENVGSAGGGNSDDNGDGPGPKEDCGPPPGYNRYLPKSPSFNGRKDLVKVGKHQKQQGDNWVYGNCQIRTMGDPPSHGWEEIAEVPVYTPPVVTIEPGITAEQAAALNEEAELAAQLTGLQQAMVVTLDRMGGASQAGEWHWAAVQLDAFRDFAAQTILNLRAYGDSIDDLLAATQGIGIPDVILTPADYEAELQQLQNTGFPTETVVYLQATGYDAALIDQMLADNITLLQQVPIEMTTFYTVLANQRDASLALADDLASWYGISSSQLQLDALSGFVATPPQYATFTVGNPTGNQATVELRIRPVDVPINWSYSLSDPAPNLAPGETTKISLRMDPGASMLRGRMVTIAVEGFINGEYVGGVLIQRMIPERVFSLYLPFLSKG